MIGLQKSRKLGNQTFPDHLDHLQNIDTKVEHQHYRRIGIMEEIQDMILYENEEDEEDSLLS